jgi:hypothetical protein
MKVAVFWDVKLLSLVSRYQVSEEAAACLFRVEDEDSNRLHVIR